MSANEENYSTPPKGQPNLENLLEAIQANTNTLSSLTTNVRDKFNSIEYNLSNMQSTFTQKVDQVQNDVTEVKAVVTNHQERIIQMEAEIKQLHQRPRGQQGYSNANSNSEKSFSLHNWHYNNGGQPVDLFTKYDLRQYFKVVKEVQYFRSGLTKVIFANGRDKYHFACVLKSNLHKLQEDGVSLPSGNMTWITSGEVKTLEQLNADNTIVLTETCNTNSNPANGNTPANGNIGNNPGNGNNRNNINQNFM